LLTDKVSRALHRALDRTFGIKVIHRQDDDARRRLHQEAVVLHSQLANEFVVGLLDHTGLMTRPRISYGPEVRSG